MIGFKKLGIVATLLLSPCSWAAEINAGCSGGYNGSGSGVLVKDTGAILGWSLESYRDSRQTRPLRTDAATAKALFDGLQAIEFTSIDHNYPANMSCFLRLTQADNQVHAVQWPFGSTGVPPTVLDLYQKVRALAEPAANTP